MEAPTVFAKEDSVRFKKSIRWKRSVRFNTFTRHMRLKAFTRLPMKTRAGVITMAVISVTVLAMLIGGREPSQRDNATHAGARNAASLPAIPDPTGTTGPAVEFASKASTAKPAPVTITGCLERDDETFRLKDTAGADAPKSRSWKSGFLKKGSASIEVVDASKRLKLPDHVGQRVSVTGVLVNREMQVRSMQRVATSCTNSSRVKI
ncbi:MAG: hypothetical protein AUH72_11810 [Acidobacteria bacterium 13_1_40CM_4_65_8]|nr:MAG: hypothetical protein AUH72_11810 [Acidobacteria bacterium 13_1_40CM_4_65_8]OLE79204.1 MAG: hypothetical protein AUF76_17390 [Acidobacteria bacterium 13_1_20CM_2_65_9]